MEAYSCSSYITGGPPAQVQIKNTNFTGNHGSAGAHKDYGAAIALSIRRYPTHECYHEIRNW